jgi:hypothetical protein
MTSTAIFTVAALIIQAALSPQAPDANARERTQPDPLQASEALIAVAIAQGAARDFSPIPLDQDGATTHGVVFDQFRLIARAARAAAAARTRLDAAPLPRASTNRGARVSVVLRRPIHEPGSDRARGCSRIDHSGGGLHPRCCHRRAASRRAGARRQPGRHIPDPDLAPDGHGPNHLLEWSVHGWTVGTRVSGRVQTSTHAPSADATAPSGPGPGRGARTPSGACRSRRPAATGGVRQRAGSSHPGRRRSDSALALRTSANQRCPDRPCGARSGRLQTVGITDH